MTKTIMIDGRPVPPWWAASVALIESLPDTHDGRQMAMHIMLGLMPSVSVSTREDIATIQAELLSGGLGPDGAAYRLDEMTDETE